MFLLRGEILNERSTERLHGGLVGIVAEAEVFSTQFGFMGADELTGIDIDYMLIQRPLMLSSTGSVMVLLTLSGRH